MAQVSNAHNQKSYLELIYKMDKEVEKYSIRKKGIFYVFSSKMEKG
jgi:hypothetical protein